MDAGSGHLLKEIGMLSPEMNPTCRPISNGCQQTENLHSVIVAVECLNCASWMVLFDHLFWEVPAESWHQQGAVNVIQCHGKFWSVP